MTRKKASIRKWVKTLHLWLGLASGIVVFIVALSGALFAFEEEGRDLFQHEFLYVAASGNSRLPLQQMTDTIKQHFPKESITSIRFKENKNAAFVFLTKKRNAISVNPYTAQIIGVRNLDKDFFSVIQNLHTHLLLGDTGNEIVRWNVLVFFIMCITGLVLWWPKQKKFLRQALKINFKTKNRKRLNWDLHSVLGFYALIVLLIISLTGLFWMFDTTKNIVARLTNSPLPKKEKKIKSKANSSGNNYTIGQAYAYMQANYPGAGETIITFPKDSTDVLRVLMRYPYSIVRKQNTLYFDQYNGKVLGAELYDHYTVYDKVARSNYDFHTGRIRLFGIGTKIVWFLSALVAASLPVTGFMIWWGRKRKNKKRIITKDAVAIE